MAQFCRNCGNELEGEVKFCNHCGTPVDGAMPAVNQNNGGNGARIQEKNLATCIILSIITCGIYGLIWFVQMTDDANTVSNDNSTSGGMALLLTIITCGIYGIYWNYMMGKKLYDAGKNNNIEIADNSTLYLILSIFGLGIVSECLIQSDLNKFAK